MVKEFEKQVYFPLVEQFEEDKIDFEMIGRIIINVCNKMEYLNSDVEPKTIVKNALLLVLGLLHKDEPVEEYGKDFWSLSDEEIVQLKKELKDALS